MGPLGSMEGGARFLPVGPPFFLWLTLGGARALESSPLPLGRGVPLESDLSAASCSLTEGVEGKSASLSLDRRRMTILLFDMMAACGGCRQALAEECVGDDDDDLVVRRGDVGVDVEVEGCAQSLRRW